MPKRNKVILNSTNTSYHFGILSFLVSVLLIMLLGGCSNHHMPAPVVSLSTKTATPQNLSEITTDTYTVEPGDTLFAIAFYSGNDYRELAKLNNISSPYTIKLGQLLRIRPVRSSIVSSETLAVAKPLPEQRTQSTATKPSERQQRAPTATPKPAFNTRNPAQNTSWIWPANGNRTIATVGSDGGTRGLDIKGRLGSKVLAAASGKVVYAGNALKGYGKLIIIKHNSDYLSAYAHNSKILVREQSYVKQGQQIATMGNSGASEVMLHFEIRNKGKSINPLKYLPVQ